MDPQKFILGSMVCLSLAVKFDECGQQMKYEDEINPNETLPQHRNYKHRAIYEKIKLIIMVEQQSGMLINQDEQINCQIINMECSIIKAMKFNIDFHTGFEISREFLIQSIRKVIEIQNLDVKNSMIHNFSM